MDAQPITLAGDPHVFFTLFLNTVQYSLIRYLGGYYRDFLPKIWRRKKRVHYDQFGEITFNERDPKYHSGFPQRLEVCHEDDIDVGAPTHVRFVQDLLNFLTQSKASRHRLDWLGCSTPTPTTPPKNRRVSSIP